MPEEKKKKQNLFSRLTWKQHIAAGWPLILIFVGGAVGGALGAAAYFINAKIFLSGKTNASKFFMSALTGIGAIAGYIIIVGMLAMSFPNLFPAFGESFKSSYRESFIESCTKSDDSAGQRMMCECLADDVLANLSVKQAVNIKYSQEYIESKAYPACIEKLNDGNA